MTIRKRKTPAPHFKVPPPYQPLTGEHAPLSVAGKPTYCAMMQIAEADTHDDYVICRGYDPEARRHFDSIPVAKPYGIRGSNPYVVGQVFPALKPMTTLGVTSGVAATTEGHPADLNEVINILYDDAAALEIPWLLLDSLGGSSALEVHFELEDDMPTSGSVSPGQQATAYVQAWSGSAWVTDTDVEIEVYDKLGVYRGREKANGFTAPHDVGSYGTAAFVIGSNRWEITSMQPSALMILGLATGDFTSSTFTIDGTAVMQPPGAIITDQDPAGNITISDYFDFDGSNNDKVIAVWDESTPDWKLLQRAC